MDQLLLKRLKDFMNPSSEMNFEGIPATEEEISKAENELNVSFHDDYKTFIKKFGGAYVGIPIYAFTNNEMLAEDTIVDITKQFRLDYEGDARSSIINDCLVISFDGSGNPIMINPNGQILTFYHDNDEVKILSNSLPELLNKLLDGELNTEF